MSMTYAVTKIPGRRYEAATELHWYAHSGSYKIDVVGFGFTEADAIKSASLMLGQARAALHVAMIDIVPNRVPETPTENADERTDHRPQHAD